jgi:hypothetical protein
MVRLLARRAIRSAILSPLLAGMLASASPGEVRAEAKLDAHYRVSIAGLQVGGGSWIVDIADDRYTMAASGEVNGFLRAFSSGSGSAAARGAIQGNRFVPSAFAMSIKSRNKVDEVRMALAGGTIKTLMVQPPIEYGPDHVPLTEAHKRGVLDMISAGVIPRAGADGVGPEACQRTVSIFDGRQRFDLTLSYKRTERVKTESGYEGAVAACGVRYNPVAGYEKAKYANSFLRESRDIEIWYAPIAGTRFLAVYRITVPTMFGPAILHATRFVVTAKGPRSGAANARTQ